MPSNERVGVVIPTQDLTKCRECLLAVTRRSVNRPLDADGADVGSLIALG